MPTHDNKFIHSFLHYQAESSFPLPFPFSFSQCSRLNYQNFPFSMLFFCRILPFLAPFYQRYVCVCIPSTAWMYSVFSPLNSFPCWFKLFSSHIDSKWIFFSFFGMMRDGVGFLLSSIPFMFHIESSILCRGVSFSL